MVVGVIRRGLDGSAIAVILHSLMFLNDETLGAWPESARVRIRPLGVMLTPSITVGSSQSSPAASIHEKPD